MSKVCIAILLALSFICVQSIILESLDLGEGRFVTVHPCKEDIPDNSTNIDTFNSLCLSTYQKDGKFKAFKVNNEKIVNNITYVSATNVKGAAAIGITENTTDSIRLLTCGHGSCTTFRSSNNIIEASEGTNIGIGLSITTNTTDNFVAMSHFKKSSEGVSVEFIDCRKEHCDEWNTHDASPIMREFIEENLSTKIFYNEKDDSVTIVANLGHEVVSFQGKKEFAQTTLFDFPVTNFKIRKSPENDSYKVSFISNNHGYIGECNSELTECTSFVPPFTPGNLGDIDFEFHEKSDAIQVVYGSSIAHNETTATVIQTANCEVSSCKNVNLDFYNFESVEDQRLYINIATINSTLTAIRFQNHNVTSWVTTLACKDLECSSYETETIDPTLLISSRYQKRVNIIWAIIILPALAVSAAVVLLIWRIRAHRKDKKTAYQPIA